jgi:adenine-specific DNA-methyltransferase
MSIDKIKTGDDLTQSLDIVSDNISKLKELFPEVLTEGKIDFQVLQDILGNEIEEDEEFYRFTWAGKSQSRREAHKPSTGTLRPCKEESVDWDTTQNLYIEGDNLEVLKLLQKSYSNKVKMIYIDPPYNTGKDFVYKDNYKDNLKNYQQITGQVDDDGNKMSTNSESDGRYHSNWLNMMYPRLRLSRNLLKDDGVIFISIDDNEIDNLKKLCNEIFGENCFKGQITVVNNPRGRDYGGIAKMHEYLLVYVKNFSTDLNDLDNPNKEFPFYDNISGFELRELRNRNIAFHKGNRPNLYYPFYINPNNQLDNNLFEISLEFKPGFIELFPKESQGYNTVWRWGKEKSSQNLNINISGKKMTDGGYMIVEKYRKSTRMARSVWSDKEDNSEKGTLLLKSIFDGKKVFDFPKSMEMITKIIEMGTSENEDIVLDFFSGSGSTAHSVIHLNSRVGGNRKYIQIQLPEKTDETSESFKLGYKTIAEIGKERIRKSGNIVKLELKEKIIHLKSKTEGKILQEDELLKIQELQKILENLDTGFKVFKLDSSNIKGWDGLPDNLENSLFESQDNIKSDRIEEDVLFEILLKYGLDLTLPIEEKVIEGKKVFNVGFGALFICLGNDLTSKIAEGIGQWKETLKPETCRVIFKDGGFTDVEKTNSVQTLKRFGIQEIKSI